MLRLRAAQVESTGPKKGFLIPVCPGSFFGRGAAGASLLRLRQSTSMGEPSVCIEKFPNSPGRWMIFPTQAGGGALRPPAMRRHIPQRPGGPDQEESATSAGCAGGIHRAQKKVPHPSLSREFLGAAAVGLSGLSVASEHPDGRTSVCIEKFPNSPGRWMIFPTQAGGGRVEAAGDAATHPAEA
jgi:hypothetical protein